MWHCTVVWHCGVALWCGTVVWHCGAALWSGTVVWHCDVALWCGTVVWHCGVALWTPLFLKVLARCQLGMKGCWHSARGQNTFRSIACVFSFIFNLCWVSF